MCLCVCVFLWWEKREKDASHFVCMYGYIVKKNNNLQMESFVLTTANKDLIAVSTSPMNVTFKQTIWNFLINTSEIICIIRPLLFPPPPPRPAPKRRFPSLKQFFLFFLPTTTLPYLPSACRGLPFCTTPQSTLLVASWVATRFMNRLTNPVRSSNLFGWILFFNNSIWL